MIAGVQDVGRAEGPLIHLRVGHVALRIRPEAIEAERQENMHPQLFQLLHHGVQRVGASQIFGIRKKIDRGEAFRLVLINQRGAGQHGRVHAQTVHIPDHGLPLLPGKLPQGGIVIFSFHGAVMTEFDPGTFNGFHHRTDLLAVFILPEAGKGFLQSILSRKNGTVNRFSRFSGPLFFRPVSGLRFRIRGRPETFPRPGFQAVRDRRNGPSAALIFFLNSDIIAVIWFN